MTTTSKKVERVCSICEGSIEPHGTWLDGHNAQPINNGRCCDTCNSTVVIPTRLLRMTLGNIFAVRL